MGFFSGTNEAALPGSSNKIRPGSYPKLTIVKCKFIESHYGPKYIVEMRVDADPVESVPGSTPSPKGSVVDWVTNAGPGNDKYGHGRSERKSFALGVLGTDDESTDVEGPLEDSLQGGFNGKTVGATIWTHTTSNNREVTKALYRAASEPVEASAPPPPAGDEPEGGPWFKFPTPDPRGNRYNSKGDIITV